MGSVSEGSEFEGSFVGSLIGMFSYAMSEDTASQNLGWFLVIWSYYPLNYYVVYQRCFLTLSEIKGEKNIKEIMI